MMRVLIPLFFFLLASSLRAQQVIQSSTPAIPQKDSSKVFNPTLKPDEMKQDLNLFYNLRKEANSGLYRYRTKKATDSIYAWAYRQIKKPMSTTNFFKIILQLTNFEGSCHNYTTPAASLVDYYNRQTAFFPFALKYIEGKMIFNSPSDQIPVGARVLSINGVADKQLMNSFYKYATSDGYNTSQKLSSSVNKSFGLRYLYEYGLQQHFHIRFLAPGAKKVQTITVDAVTLQERNKNVENRHSALVENLIDYKKQPAYSFKMINPSTALLSFRIFTMANDANDPRFKPYVAFIDSVFTTLETNKIPNLILDLRGNPGGSDPTFEQPMMYLTDSVFRENRLAYTIFGDAIPYEKYFWGVSPTKRMTAEELAEGKALLKDYFPLLKNGRNMQNAKYNPIYDPKSPGYKGKLYMLIDEDVGSAASHLASLIKAYARNVTTVGVETVGGYYAHNGHMAVVYELPNSKIKSKFSIVHVVQDAPVKKDQPDGRGIIPDYTVWPNYADFMANKDTQMEYVLKLIGK